MRPLNLLRPGIRARVYARELREQHTVFSERLFLISGKDNSKSYRAIQFRLRIHKVYDNNSLVIKLSTKIDLFFQSSRFFRASIFFGS